MMDGKFEALPVGPFVAVSVLNQPFSSPTLGSPSASACAAASYVLRSKAFHLSLNHWQGRAFAWQEMMLVTALVFQRFDVTLADPSYELVIKQTLTIKPKDFHVRVALRADRAPPPPPRPSTFSAHSARGAGSGIGGVSLGDAAQPVYVVYGSNTGTSETFAQRVVNDAAARGMYHRWVYA